LRAIISEIESREPISENNILKKASQKEAFFFLVEYPSLTARETLSQPVIPARVAKAAARQEPTDNFYSIFWIPDIILQNETRPE
jgi:hypothetical protein